MQRNKKRREFRGVFYSNNSTCYKLQTVALDKHLFALFPELRRYDH